MFGGAISGGLVALVFIAMVFGVGAIALITEHLQKIAGIKAEAQKKGSGDLMQAVEALRREVTHLRDTTTNYDLSVDSALQRLESRMANMEQRVILAEKPAEPASAAQAGR